MTEDIKPDAETAFLVVKEFDGSWSATANINAPLIITRPALRADIKAGSREVSDFLVEDDLANTLLGKIQQNNISDSSQRATEIRNALSDRNIL